MLLETETLKWYKYIDKLKILVSSFSTNVLYSSHLCLPHKDNYSSPSKTIYKLPLRTTFMHAGRHHTLSYYWIWTTNLNKLKYSNATHKLNTCLLVKQSTNALWSPFICMIDEETSHFHLPLKFNRIGKLC